MEVKRETKPTRVYFQRRERRRVIVVRSASSAWRSLYLRSLGERQRRSFDSDRLLLSSLQCATLRDKCRLNPLSYGTCSRRE